MPVPFLMARFLARARIARWLPAVRRRCGSASKILHLINDRMISTQLRHLDDWSVWLNGASPQCINLAGMPLPATINDYDRPIVCNGGESFPVQGAPELCAKIAQQESPSFGRELHPSHEVIVTHGARGAYQLVLDTYLNRGDRVVLFDPTSPFVLDAVRCRGAKIRWVASAAPNGDNLCRAIAGSKLVIVGSPNNPDGCVLDESVVSAIAHAVSRYDALLILDRSLAAWDAGQPVVVPRHGRKRTLMINRFAPGGIGSLCGPESLVRPCLLSAVVTATPVPAILQQNASRLLPAATEMLARRHQQLSATRRYVIDRMMQIGLCPTEVGSGPFVWAKTSSLTATGRQYCQYLSRKHDVWLAPGDRFGPSGREYVRLNICGDEGRLREGLRRMTGAVASGFQRRQAESLPPCHEAA